MLDILTPSVGYTEIRWNMLGHAGICWDMLGYAGLCWDMLGYTGTRWATLGYAMNTSCHPSSKCPVLSPLPGSWGLPTCWCTPAIPLSLSLLWMTPEHFDHGAESPGPWMRLSRDRWGHDTHIFMPPLVSHTLAWSPLHGQSFCERTQQEGIPGSALAGFASL